MAARQRRPIRTSELAALLGREVEGAGDPVLDGAASLEAAGPRDLAHVRSPAFASALAATRAAVVIAPPGLDAGDRCVIRSHNPGLDFARAVRRIVPQPPAPAGIHETAVVAPDAELDASASIGPHCSIGARAKLGANSVLHAGVVLYEDVTIGADCVVHARCILREGTLLGDRVVLQPAVVLGGDGFGYLPAEDGSFEKAPQLGRVVVADDVEIGANTCVDRGTLADTRIGRGSKLDNLVQIAHNCAIGERAIVVSQAGLAGSTILEEGAIVMAQAGVAGHLTIGAGAFVGPQCGVHKDVKAGSRVLGSPQRPERTFHRLMAALSRLPDVMRRLRAIERQLGVRSDRDAT